MSAKHQFQAAAQLKMDTHVFRVPWPLRGIGLAFLLAACGGSQGPPPPPASDFGLSLSPYSASAVVGNTTAPITISFMPVNGFQDSVAITLQGIPQGVSAMPASSFSVEAGAGQSVTFAVSASATAGVFPITVVGTSAKLSHSVQLMLTTEPVVSVRTFQSGSLLYLESRTNTDTARVGLETQWGGSIVEVSLNGTNYVNWHDTGREVQAAQYDGNAKYDACAGCTGTFGWNPVQAGDKWDQGSPVLAQLVNSDSLYVKAQGYQWNPDDKGGGPGQPVLGDTYVEATITAEIEHALTFKMHFKVTHFGADQHANSIQEFPAVYVNLGFDRFATYRGSVPWTNGVISFQSLPPLPGGGPLLHVPERWGALVDSQDTGLTVFNPSAASYIGGFTAAGDPGPTGLGTNYFNAFTNYTFGAGAVLEGDVYLVAGDYKHARQVIYDLHARLPAADIFTPWGSVDAPAENASLSGTASVSGWAVDDTAVSRVDVYVDGVLAGTATYGESRPDVGGDFPSAPIACGYSLPLDTHNYANGPHVIEIKAADTSGNLAVFPRVPVTIQN